MKLDHEMGLEEIKLKNEQIKMEGDLEKLTFIRDGKMLAFSLNIDVGSCFDVASNLRLLPKFDEAEVEIFFCLFESRRWPDEERTLLQCVVMGKTQSAYAAVSRGL